MSHLDAQPVLRHLKYVVLSDVRPDHWLPVPNGFKHWPHRVAQTITFADVEDAAFDRTYVSVRIETDFLRDLGEVRVARAMRRRFALNGVGGAPFLDGHRIRLRSHVHLERRDLNHAYLAAEAAMDHACCTFRHHRTIERGGARDGPARARGVPDRSVHPERGARLENLESLGLRLRALASLDADRPPRNAVRVVPHVHRVLDARGFANVEVGDLDGWLSIRYDLEAVDFDAGLAARGRDDGFAVAYARIDSGIHHPWLGPVFAFRTLVPVPEWLGDAEGWAWAERFDAAELAPGATRYGLGAWAFDRRFRRWVYTTVQPVVWTGGSRAAELLRDMGRRALWWLRTQRPQVLAAR